ncbi:ester cyclase [Streptomyces coeruleorubidus]|uniref:ester cyclase n=1 Tax=Streptomyces coeruleorubidus TaxID=116188 RepID=UPI00237FBF0B|nr:ester cyclase [Streptomyces coeruleorubidus]WDV53190.1 ester cyclase [Streptomyces coeruleorubidus]
MSAETNKALVRRLFEEVLNGRRMEIIDELAATDYQEHDPFPGQREGREGLKDRVTMLVEGLAPTFSIDEIIAEGDRVVVRWTNSATHSGTFLGIPPTGRSCRFAGVDFFRLDGGRLVEHWHVVDQLSMLQQLELLPSS